MSFILDALKKSEAERQKQSGPTLLELRITQPRRRYPLWALLIGCLLGINVVVLAVLLLRRPASPTPEAPSPALTVARAAAPAPAAAAAPATSAPAASAPTAPAAPAAGSSAPPIATARSAPAPTPTPTPTPTSSAATAAAPDGNPADYAPAIPAAAADAHAGVSSRPAGSSSDYAALPSLSELSGSVPSLQLDLLDYSDQPSDRYALINMHRVQEGDVLADGTRVLAITRNGVAMEYRGQQFMLRPGGTVQ